MTPVPSTQPAHHRSSTIELVLTAIERLAVIGAITFVWGAGKLDPTIAVVALTAVVGVSLSERLKSGSKGGGASLVLALAGLVSVSMTV